MKYLAALTKLDQPTYPGYVNFTRLDDGSVRITVRGDPKEINGRRVCGRTCFAHDKHCNNYCNLAPEKGPMARRPMELTYMGCGESVSLVLSAKEFAELMYQAGQ